MLAERSSRLPWASLAARARDGGSLEPSFVDEVRSAVYKEELGMRSPYRSGKRRTVRRMMASGGVFSYQWLRTIVGTWANGKSNEMQLKNKGVIGIVMGFAREGRCV